MNFELLPLELKIHIFSFVPFDDLQFKVSSVSKQWQTLSQDPCAVNHIKIDKRFDSKEIIHFLTHYKRIRSLKISNIFTFDWVFDIPINHNLRRLHFDGCRFEPATLTFLSTRFPSISEIKVRRCEYSHTAVLDQPSPENINFGRCSSDFLQQFATNCRCLEEIEMDGYGELNETSIQTLLDLHGSSLKKLSISEENVTSLPQCPQMADLGYFCVWVISDLTLLQIKKLKTLRSLCIKRCHFVSDDALTELFINPVFPHLRDINLHACDNLEDATVKIISSNYPRLRSLDISSCYQITNTSVLSVIENCSDMEFLNVAENINVTGYIITRLIPRLLHLKYLNIRNCTQILRTDFYRIKLLESFPRLQLID